MAQGKVHIAVICNRSALEPHFLPETQASMKILPSSCNLQPPFLLETQVNTRTLHSRHALHSLFRLETQVNMNIPCNPRAPQPPQVKMGLLCNNLEVARKHRNSSPRPRPWTLQHSYGPLKNLLDNSAILEGG